MTRTLTDTELDHYHRTGFLLVRDLVSPTEVCALGERLREYTHSGRATGALRIQVEPRVTRGEMSVEHPGDGIRKIDGLVENDDLFERLGKHPNLLGVLTSILGPDIKMFRNALLLKPPEVGSAKGMHQDSPIGPLNPWSCAPAGFPWTTQRWKTAAWP